MLVKMKIKYSLTTKQYLLLVIFLVRLSCTHIFIEKFSFFVLLKKKAFLLSSSS